MTDILVKSNKITIHLCSPEVTVKSQYFEHWYLKEPLISKNIVWINFNSFYGKPNRIYDGNEA